MVPVHPAAEAHEATGIHDAAAQVREALLERAAADVPPAILLLTNSHPDQPLRYL